MFWGYFPAYDWVAFVGLFGGLEELPFHYPQLCLDIKQWAIELGDPELPRQTTSAPPRAQRRPLDARRLDVSGRLHPAGAARRAHGRKNPGQFAAARSRISAGQPPTST